MTKAVDPFEEFLRKKSAEKQGNPTGKKASADPAQPQPREQSIEEEWTPRDPHADPAADKRVREEMSEFFEEGADAGAELFASASNIDDERVDEIKDALEDVFDTEQSEPEVDESDDTFIDFFKQVQTSFDPELVDLRQQQQELAREVVEPPKSGPFEDEPLTTEFPPPEQPAELKLAPEPEAPRMPVEAKQPFAPEPAELVLDIPMPEPEAVVPAAEHVAEDAGFVELTELDKFPDFPEFPDPMEEEPVAAQEVQSSPNSADRLSLSDVLAPTQDADDLARRVEVLTRFVIKLVERSQLPESEIVEVLIKSGMMF